MSGDDWQLEMLCNIGASEILMPIGSFAVRKRWPEVQEGFLRWAQEHRHEFKLGNVRLTEIDGSLGIVHMICQHGYGPSASPRVRYAELKACLERLADLSIQHHASVHMPRIATGEAGGSWSIAGELIEEALCKKGIAVTVYDLPHRDIRRSCRGGAAR